jgi:hypothetical protein
MWDLVYQSTRCENDMGRIINEIDTRNQSRPFGEALL